MKKCLFPQSSKINKQINHKVLDNLRMSFLGYIVVKGLTVLVSKIWIGYLGRLVGKTWLGLLRLG
jgi:hypothetical protein